MITLFTQLAEPTMAWLGKAHSAPVLIHPSPLHLEKHSVNHPDFDIQKEVAERPVVEMPHFH